MEYISIRDENGKEYKFEKPDFECVLHFTSTNNTLGTVYIFGVANNKPAHWDTKGNASSSYNGITMQDYNLTPIKPEWYEDESNFPMLVCVRTTCEIYLASSYRHNKLKLMSGSIVDARLYRPATRAEVESLIYKGGVE